MFACIILSFYACVNSCTDIIMCALTISQIEFNNTDDAIALVEQGDAWAAVVIYESFTWELVVRMCSITSEQCKKYPIIPEPDLNTIPNSTIHIFADITSKSVLSLFVCQN